MKNTTRKLPVTASASALVGVAIPVLVAAGAHAADARFTEGINLCVEMREKVFECKEDFADAFVAQHNPPPERRKALREKALEEITADGSGPLPPRQEKCQLMTKAISAQGDPEQLQAKLDGMKKLIAFCSAKAECKERVECMMPFIKPGMGKATGKTAGKPKAN
jgi:hypothetical protein